MPELKGTFIAALRFIYQNLPISLPTKNRLKEIYLQLSRSLSAKTGSGHCNTSVAHYSPPKIATGLRPAHEQIIELFTTSPQEISAGYDVPPELYKNSDELASPQIHIFNSFEAYKAQRENRASIRYIRNKFESGLLHEDQMPFQVQGFCSVCNDSKQFDVDYLYAYEKDEQGRLLPNWRESLVCESCKLNNRVRAAVDILSNQISIYGGDRIYTTEQLTQFYLWLKARYCNVVGSEFLADDKVSGRVYENLRHEDITRLSFDNESLDAVLSFDVLEHVPDTKASLSEFMRCLKPGGFALISAPFVSNNSETIVRARVADDGSIEHILEAEYHGNPTDPEKGSLCFYYFGWDLLDQLRASGAKDAAVLSYYSAERANIGNEQLFFVALK